MEGGREAEDNSAKGFVGAPGDTACAEVGRGVGKRGDVGQILDRVGQGGGFAKSAGQTEGGNSCRKTENLAVAGVDGAVFKQNRH